MKGLKKWTPEADARSQKVWQREVSTRVDKKALVQAGVFFSPPRWSVSELAPQEGPNLQYVKSFGMLYVVLTKSAPTVLVGKQA
jgi:hypothetical protein